VISQARLWPLFLLSFWERIEVRVNCFVTMIALTISSPKKPRVKSNFI